MSKVYVTAAKEIYLTESGLLVRFKRATINNSGSNVTQHVSHRNFLKSANESGRGSDTKIQACSNLRDRH